jgi:hypothetical protein
MDENNNMLNNLNTIETNQSGIYLTGTNDVKNTINDISKNNIILNKSSILPPIKNLHSLSNNLDNKIFLSNRFKLNKFHNNIRNINIQNININNNNNDKNLNSYFQKENYDLYYDSCNKFTPKIDKIFKDSINPKNIILQSRHYDLIENKMLSDINKDEMIQRSIGHGMPIKLMQYKKLNLRRNNNSIDFINNNNYLLYEMIKNNLVIENEKVKNYLKNVNILKKKTKPRYSHLYTENFSIRKSILKNTPMNQIFRNDKPPNILCDYEKDKENKKVSDYKSKKRDQDILRSLEKSGSNELKYLIIN